MSKGIQRVRAVLDKIVSCERYICACFLIILTAITFVQVVMRFVFSAPFSWAEEVTLIFLVWFGYLCMAVDIYTDGHAALYFLYNLMPPMLKKAADLLRHGLLTWFFALMIIYGQKITLLNLRKPLPATRFSQAWMFSPLVVGGALMLLYSMVNFLSVLFKSRREYQDEMNKEKTLEDLNTERGGTV